MSLVNSYVYKGRHRAPVDSPIRNATSAGALALSLGIPLLPISSGTAVADPPGGWDAIISCESGGRNVHTAIVGPYTASGYFQITNGTWRANGGGEFASTAMGATLAEQKIVANRIYEARGSLADWSASKGCWSKKQGTKVAIQAAKPAPTTKPEPKAPVKVTQKVTKKSPAKVRTVNTQPITAGNYTIKTGDTLSEISPSNWRSVWKNNRVVLGDNPDLIHPGQVINTRI